MCSCHMLYILVCVCEWKESRIFIAFFICLQVRLKVLPVTAAYGLLKAATW